MPCAIRIKSSVSDRHRDCQLSNKAGLDDISQQKRRQITTRWRFRFLDPCVGEEGNSIVVFFRFGHRRQKRRKKRKEEVEVQCTIYPPRGASLLYRSLLRSIGGGEENQFPLSHTHFQSPHTQKEGSLFPPFIS